MNRMKCKKTLLVFIILTILGCMPIAIASVPDNMVVFNGGNNQNVNLNFVWGGDYSITDGQQWKGVKISSGENSSFLVVNARSGRADSSQPARWFNDKAWTSLSSARFMSMSMSFAFTGTLYINNNDYAVVLGMQTSGSGQGWYIGGNGLANYVYMSNFNNGTMSINTNDNKYRISCGNSVNTFVVEAVK